VLTRSVSSPGPLDLLRRAGRRAGRVARGPTANDHGIVKPGTVFGRPARISSTGSAAGCSPQRWVNARPAPDVSRQQSESRRWRRDGPTTPDAGAPRFVGLDVHQASALVGAVNARQETVLHPQRVALTDCDGWIDKHRRSSDGVALEARATAGDLPDRRVGRVRGVTVAPPRLGHLRGTSPVQTDARDPLTLARLLAANLLPAVGVPPPPVRELRALIAQRRRLVGQRPPARNRLHGVLHRHNLGAPGTSPLAPEQRVWGEGLPLAPTEKLRVRQDLLLLTPLAGLLGEVEDELGRLSRAEPWAEQVPFLVQVPGIRLRSAMTRLAASGEIDRFPTAQHLGGEAGLGAAVPASGQRHPRRDHQAGAPGPPFRSGRGRLARRRDQPDREGHRRDAHPTEVRAAGDRRDRPPAPGGRLARPAGAGRRLSRRGGNRGAPALQRGAQLRREDRALPLAAFTRAGLERWKLGEDRTALHRRPAGPVVSLPPATAYVATACAIGNRINNRGIKRQGVEDTGTLRRPR
jgi:hypothetical protein